ncbi:S1 family peptidase [Chondromyces crocatus]|nr:S1 family peptidase [Chondromyces crocatus]
MAAASLAGCVGEAVDDTTQDPSIGESSQGIRGGYETNEHPAIVGILALFERDSALCTGTLIAPNVVLTAQHCVADIENDVNGGVACGRTTFGAPYRPGQFFVTTRPSLSDEMEDYVAVRDVLVPEGRIQVCGDDVAILVLDRPLTAEEAVPVTPRVDESLVKNEQYTALGYGATDDFGSGAGSRRQRDGLTVTCVAEACPAFYATPAEWQGDAGICQGDSGGPAIDAAGRVVGVASRGAAECELPIYAHVFAWADWLKEKTVHAAGLAGYEAPPWTRGTPTNPVYEAPTGASCSSDETCAGGICHDGYCSRPCTELAACPSGYTCKTATDAESEEAFCARSATPRSDEDASAQSSGALCSVGSPGEDPTKPIPWIVSGAVGALALLRRRRAC